MAMCVCVHACICTWILARLAINIVWNSTMSHYHESLSCSDQYSLQW